MTRSNDQPDRLAELFRDVVLVLGGVFAVRGTDVETIQQVARGLGRVYRRARSRNADTTAGSPAPRFATPHPAILELLQLTEPEETSA